MHALRAVGYFGPMPRAGRTGGWALIGIGLLVGLLPFVSVWRTSGMVLEQLPEVTSAEINDQRSWAGAVFDDDFKLATRTYAGVTIESVRAALVADGFERIGADRFSRSCCGESDAVWVTVERTTAESVAVVLTVADSDWRTLWKAFAVFSLLLVLAGSRIVVRSDKRSDRVPELV